ncbi:MAG: hypothetical protein WC741_01555 [Patescibacteria group bacterium]|jgi:hypothetical protein
MIKLLKRISFILLFIIPFFIIIKPILSGAIPFWYDPGRDLLMAWDNLKKISLIGPTSGIPGIFYGPQWIWLLSIGVAISKDPRVVLFLIISLPYFVGIPLAIYFLNKSLVEKLTVPATWILAIFCFSSYITQIWSPNLAPLFLFVLLTLFYKTKEIRAERNIKSFMIMGLIYGLLLNHHISLGVVFLVTWIIYFFTTFFLSILDKKRLKENLLNWLINTVSFWSGLMIMLLPFFLFEVRHGFMQIKSLIFTLSKSTAVVGQIGISKYEIVQKFIERSSVALSIPQQFSIFVIVLIIAGIFFNLLKKRFSKDDLKLLLFLVLNILSLFIVYFGTKNPVWNYHFISVEVVFIFLTLLAIKKNRILQYVIFSWAIILLISKIVTFTQSFMKQNSQGELMAKKSNVEFILNDTKNASFVYFAKNPSIYSYDYDYIFRWIGEIKKKYPNQNPDTAVNTYIIVPNDVKNDKVGFTLNRTPDEKYYTASEWLREDKTMIIKRLHK